MKAALIGLLIAIIAFWGINARCSESPGNKVVDMVSDKPKCGCMGKSVMLSDHWLDGGERTYLCLGIPQ